MQKKLSFIFILVAGFLLPLHGWANGAESGFNALISKGRPLFLHYCAHCHGIKGHGDGYNAEQLDKEPAELSDTKFISKKSNDQIYRVISQGGIGVKKSHLMPVFGHTLADEEIWSLVAYVRYLAQDYSRDVIVPLRVGKKRPQLASLNAKSIRNFQEWYKENASKEDIIAQGQKLFLKKKSCFGCHTIEEEGGIVGPDLSRAGFTYTPEWIFRWIRNPQSIKPQTKMPNIGLDENEDRLITAFLSNLDKAKLPDKWKQYLKVKGDPEKGRQLFFDAEGKAYCGKCHTVRGEGGKVGPNLSYVGTSRTMPFILESLLEPKAVITAGYSSVLILTKKGEFITGIKINEDDSSLDIVNKDGNKLHIEKSRIKKFKTQKISIMPGNFEDILSVEEIGDILAFLTTLTVSNLPAN